MMSYKFSNSSQKELKSKWIRSSNLYNVYFTMVEETWNMQTFHNIHIVVLSQGIPISIMKACSLLVQKAKTKLKAFEKNVKLKGQGH